MSTYIITQGGELYHYGVKGQKWGVRRYQNSDGTLTAAGRQRARKEVRTENKTAYELGKSATIAGRSAARSMKRTIKYENRLDKQYDKDPEGQKSRTRRMRSKLDASSKTTRELLDMYTTFSSKAKQHCQSLIDKYGDEAVKSIKYKDVKLPAGKESSPTFKTMNERTNNLSDYAKAGAATMASIGMTAVFGLPVTAIFSPATTAEKAYRVESTAYAANRKAQRQSKRNEAAMKVVNDYLNNRPDIPGYAEAKTKIDATYSKKVREAKTKDEVALLEIEWLEKIDELDRS